MKSEILLQLAAKLRTLPKKKFDLTMWRNDDEMCGTTACACGWAAEWFPELKLNFSPQYGLWRRIADSPLREFDFNAVATQISRTLALWCFQETYFLAVSASQAALWLQGSRCPHVPGVCVLSSLKFDLLFVLFLHFSSGCLFASALSSRPCGNAKASHIADCSIVEFW